MRRDLTGLAAAGLLTIAAAVMLLLSGLVTTGAAAMTLRVTAAIPLVLVLPGYALSALLLPDRVRPVYINAALWHGMWIAGLSLATAVLGGLLLNFLPVGLTRTSWTIALAGTTLLALATATMLRIRQPRAAAQPGSSRAAAGTLPYPAPPDTRARRPLHGPAMVYSVAAVLVAGVAIWLGVFSAARQHSAGFAELWLVPAGNGTDRATVGVRNDYARAERFHLVLQRGSQTVAQWDLELGTGKAWTAAVAAPASQRLSADLTVPGERTSPQVVALHQGASQPATGPSTSGRSQASRGRR